MKNKFFQKTTIVVQAKSQIYFLFRYCELGNVYRYEASGRNLKGKKNKYIDNEPVWKMVEQSIEQVLKDKNIPYDIDVGGAKFYGPAIDVKAVYYYR